MYFQPSLTASTPSSEPLAISVKKGENFWETALKGEQLKTMFIKFIVQFFFYAYGYDVGYGIMFLLWVWYNVLNSLVILLFLKLMDMFGCETLVY